MAKRLMKGNEAIGEAAVQAGALKYFCYPITPQTEVAEYLAKRMPEVDGMFLQGESELAVANMIFGGSATGERVFTTSSSPGISLMQEAISYIAGAQLPAVFVNIVRCGPGLGGILPSQCDYNQAVKGGGHGDYKTLVLAPSSVQEAVDLVILAFDLADKYRNPIMVIGDGMIGQMMEPVEFKVPRKKDFDKSWAATGAKGRDPLIIRSLFLDPYVLEKNNLEMQKKYKQMEAEEIRYEEYNISDKNEILLVSHGTMARICKTVIDDLEAKGVSVGLLRPITLYPFPYEAVAKAAEGKKAVISVEMSLGQQVEDVKLAILGKVPVHFWGRTGGVVPTPDETAEAITQYI
ncbi:MAG: 3-methyl-2-oxobutanoate dehydrogenase subunit VorB [Planctomycetota bacterium]|jgi:2-oxoglutarate ferredoxin oxidoreductase subunit alpha